MQKHDVINDCYVDIHNRKPTEVEIKAIEEAMPFAINILAFQWGWYDTEVRDRIYRFIKEEFK